MAKSTPRVLICTTECKFAPGCKLRTWTRLKKLPEVDGHLEPELTLPTTSSAPCVLENIPIQQNLSTLFLSSFILITCSCYEHPFTHHFYIVKLGFTRVIHFFLLIFAINMDRGYSLETGSPYPRSMFWAKIRKISHFFIWKLPFVQLWNIAVNCTDMFA